MSEREVVRVYTVVNWRTRRVHGSTCDVNQAMAWTAGICSKYGDASAATSAVDLVYPHEMDIPLARGEGDDHE